MRAFLTRLAITALGLWAADAILAGLRVEGWGNLVLAALLLGIVNALVRPVLVVLTLPITVVTLGLFLLVVNGISVAIVAWLVPGVRVASLWAAMAGALIVSAVSWFASMFVSDRGRIQRHRVIEVTGRRID